jgi:hypothetical protein
VLYQVNGVQRERLPSAARLRALTRKMPNDSVTKLGDINVKARAGSRGPWSACLVEHSANSGGQAITRAGCERVDGLQDAYIAASPIERAGDPGGRPARGGEHAARAARPRTSTSTSTGIPRLLPRAGRIPDQIAGVGDENRRGENGRELRLLTGAFPTLGTLAVTTTVMRKAAA